MLIPIIIVFLIIYKRLLGISFKTLHNSNSKSVAIIGRGPSVDKIDLNFINNIDTIVRVNSCKRNNILSKTNNIIVLSNHYKRWFRKDFNKSDESTTFCDKNTIFVYARRNNPIFDEEIIKINSLLNTNVYAISDYVIDYYSKLFDIDIKNVTTGLQAILECITKFKLPVYISGFDKLLNPNKEYTYASSYNKPDFLSKWAQKSHDFYKEHEILKYLIENGYVKII